ncbi:MAG: hypothetical protein J6O39_03375 [Treponema sp.]|nr:hypothetical protein [Treponema sp.]
MKRSRFALMTAFAALLAIGFMGCSDSGSSDSGTAGTLQEQIDKTAAGGTVTLDASLAEAGKSIIISKALTVNGNDIEGISITVCEDVAGEVTLKNFKNAKLDVDSTGSGRSLARSADSSDGEATSFKKFGDEAISLKLEGCTIEELTTVTDLALFMGNGENKSVIDSLLLKEGAEGFTFAEFDEENTATAEKSQVKDFKIEDGVKEINLIGGTFDDVNFADGFSGEIDFKYDKEFDDQLNFDNREEFLADEKVEAKDIALADDAVAENYESTSGVFMFTMSKEEFEAVNGHFDIVFLTNEQAESWINASGEINADTITFEKPAYDMSIMGAFTVAKNENGELVDGLYAVYGGSKTYRDYRNPYSYRIRTLENYMTYSKEAVVVEVAGETVNIYLNKGAIRKSDLLLCSGWRPANADENQTGTSEGGSKLSNIDLEGYYPFFALNTQSGAEFDVNSLFSTYNAKPLNAGSVLMPVSSKQEFIQDYYIYNVTDCGEYPDVSDVEYPVVAVPTTKLTVKYYDSSLAYKSSGEKVREDINLKEDGYEYYFDSDFTEILFSGDPDGNMDELYWDYIYEQKGWSANDEVILYARPERNVTIIRISLYENPGIPVEEVYQIQFDADYRIYKNYDSATEKYSSQVTSYKDIADGDTLYAVDLFVNVVAIGKESGTEPIALGKFGTMALLTITDPETQTWGLVVPCYKTASATDANAYTAESFKAVDVGETVYVTAPLVEIRESADVFTEEPDETMFFADFYALISSTENNQKFYVREYADGQENYVECTKEKLDAWLKSEHFSPLLSYEVVENLPDTSTIYIVNLNFEDSQPMETSKAAFLTSLENSYKYSKFYADEEKTTELTVEGISALENGATVYIYCDVLNVYTNSDLANFYETPASVTKEELLGSTSRYKYYTLYAAADKQTELNEAGITALSDGAAIYAYSDFVSASYETTDPETGVTEWGNPSVQYKADIIYQYYPFVEGTPTLGKVYKSQDKTEEYALDEIFMLSSDTVIYIGLNM